MTPAELFLARRWYQWASPISILCGITMAQALTALGHQHFVRSGVCAVLAGSVFIVNVKAVKLHWRDWKEQIINRRGH